MALEIVFNELPNDLPMMCDLLSSYPLSESPIECFGTDRYPEEHIGWDQIGLTGQSIISALFKIEVVTEIYLSPTQLNIEFSVPRNDVLDEQVKAALSEALNATITIHAVDFSMLTSDELWADLPADPFDFDWRLQFFLGDEFFDLSAALA